MKALAATIGKNIRRLRTDKGLNPMDLAAILGCDFALVYRWEGGYHLPSAKYLVKLADALGCTLDELAGRR